MDELTHEDLLLHRAASGNATAGDWRELEIIAATDPAVWERLAISMRDQNELLQLTRGLETAASRVDLPLGTAAPALTPGTAHHRATAASGWLAAAAITIISLLAFFTSPRPALGGSDDLTIKKSEILGELPNVLVETRAADEGGGVDVIYLRRLITKTRVTGVDELQFDDTGRAVKVPVSMNKFTTQTPL